MRKQNAREVKLLVMPVGLARRFVLEDASVSVSLWHCSFDVACWLLVFLVFVGRSACCHLSPYYIAPRQTRVHCYSIDLSYADYNNARWCCYNNVQRHIQDADITVTSKMFADYGHPME